ncbi:MAG: hypothetical protein A2X84_09075 [Desulfuromonadaceae bacterium GWC2_58_13]|nr:MAG: hypothetical protein A2X84_09075 [Desulfuromonadaceae bacterium GWC2_58_13]
MSERKRAEQELEGSRAELAANHEKLKTLFLQVEAVKKEWENCMDSIGDMVILADREGRIRRCNKTVRECTGKTYEQISGADWRTFLMDHGLKLQAPYASGTEIRHEETGKWFVFNSYPFLEHAGREMSGVVVTLHDTTELKRVTQALDDAYRELQATHAQMLHKEKMASIGLLAAGVAHEINNPLGFILSNLGTLDKYVQRLIGFVQAQAEMLASPERGGGGALLAEKRKQLKLDYIMDDITQVIAESREGAERVKKIVQNLRSFSRLDEAEWKPADLHECLENTLNMVWNEIKYKAEITRDYGELPMIDCNPGQINQVFMNLLVNAAHAIEAQGTITLRTRCEEGFVRVSIADTGCGIPEGIRARIFEPFFTTKDVGKGTGLGLGISYDIVKKHGGEILVESETGKGSTFTVVLPVGK